MEFTFLLSIYHESVLIILSPLERIIELTDRIPDMSFVLFISSIAIKISGSIRQPDESILYPTKFTDDVESSHFLFSVQPGFSIALNDFSGNSSGSL